jgi:SNF2 family DNA or RNA helicase
LFNWKDEAARFVPSMRVLEHSGPGRPRDASSFAAYDLVLTTYGTLRRDVALLKDFAFDYVVLDEAQMAKNADTVTAKAVRLLRARRRLALTGTPVENRLSELWTLFDFLNPGMLGASGAFQSCFSESALTDGKTAALLARAVRPFILRRTKAAVAPELPARMEQTLHCELEGEQKRLYDELRDHYRRTLLAEIGDDMNKARFRILTALLRLRQAACHPGLIDRQRSLDPSAKLDSLLANLVEVTEAGHKAIVFSQFTSMLAIVRNRLDGRGTPYEYLDGQTQNRDERVRRFQEDPECRVFLVSLKAGGLGLNLTAAEYVFLLDPWWNPAVEMQAIDRAHRIGQTRQVIAYRLIAKDTIEDRVLELQERKRAIANAVIGADHSFLPALTRADLEVLLA